MYKKRGIFVLCCLAAVLVVGCGQKENKNTEEQIQTVSYTHLTLPTICSV